METKKNQILNKCEQISRILIEKNKNYGNSFDEALNEYGAIVIPITLSHKFNRIKNLASKLGRISLNGGESIQDTLMDLAGYCILSSVWLDEKESGIGPNAETKDKVC